MKNFRKNKGFTLIEILVVIGIIAILAAIVIIAINPAKQFAQARNTQRVANVNAILNAVGQRIADNKGIFEGTFTIGTAFDCDKLPSSGVDINSASFDPNDFETVTTSMGTSTLGNTSGNLGCLVPTYIATLPTDPSGATSPDTGYVIDVDSTGRVSVCAPKMQTENALPNVKGKDTCVTR